MEAIRRQAVVAAAVPMVHSPQDRTRMQTEVILVTEAVLPQEDMACLHAPAPAAAANLPTAGGRALRANDHCSKCRYCSMRLSIFTQDSHMLVGVGTLNFLDALQYRAQLSRWVFWGQELCRKRLSDGVQNRRS
jgi:hypothetical protein